MAVNSTFGDLSMAEMQEIMGNYKNYKKPQNVTFNSTTQGLIQNLRGGGGTGFSAALIQYPF